MGASDGRGLEIRRWELPGRGATAVRGMVADFPPTSPLVTKIGTTAPHHLANPLPHARKRTRGLGIRHNRYTLFGSLS